MRITVAEGRVHLDLAADDDRPRFRAGWPNSTAYLGKFGVITEWDGAGGLLGLSIPVPEGEPVDIEGGSLVGDLLAPHGALTGRQF